jgi:hypothetical protein
MIEMCVRINNRDISGLHGFSEFFCCPSHLCINDKSFGAILGSQNNRVSATAKIYRQLRVNLDSFHFYELLVYFPVIEATDS